MSNQFQSLEDTIDHLIGEFSWKQFLQCFITSLAWLFDAQQVFITIFTEAKPKWSCKNTNLSLCNNTANVCQLPMDSWSWDFPATTSTISEWSLQCETPFIRGLPASSFWLGCFIGGFVLATMADSFFGRKNLLALCCLLMSLPGLLASFSTNIWMYSAIRFISGMGRAGIGSCAIVLSNELVAKSWRARMGVLGFFFCDLGFLSLPIMAYLSRGYSWRFMYRITCIPCTIYSLVVYFSVHESPRWLFVKGKRKELIQTLQSMSMASSSSTNHGDYFSGNWDEWMRIEESKQHGVYSALKILLKKRWALKRLLVMMVVSFGISLTILGLPLGLDNLSFNLYLSVALNALLGIPITIVSISIIGKFDRKGLIMGCCLVSGLCSAGCVFVRWKGMQIGLEMVSYLLVGVAFDMRLIYALELFPTSMRNSAITMVRQATVLAGALGPVVVAAGRSHNIVWLAYVSFGIINSLCGLFVVCLPETKGRTLMDSIEEYQAPNTSPFQDAVQRGAEGEVK